VEPNILEIGPPTFAVAGNLNCQLQRFWLNETAERNMFLTSISFTTFHPARLELKLFAPANIPLALSKFDTSHDPRSPLNDDEKNFDIHENIHEVKSAKAM
jgi:hypothetical protein